MRTLSPVRFRYFDSPPEDIAATFGYPENVEIIAGPCKLIVYAEEHVHKFDVIDKEFACFNADLKFEVERNG